MHPSQVEMVEFILNQSEMSSHYHRSRRSTLGWIARRRGEQGGARDVQGRHEDEPRLDKLRPRGDVRPTPRVGAESRRRLLVCPRYIIPIVKLSITKTFILLSKRLPVAARRSSG